MKNSRVATATMSDIAFHAKVSEATVCRALNNSPLVSPDTYNRIISVAKSLNYTVNKHASALRRMHSNQMLLVHCTDEGLAPLDNFRYLSWLNHYLYQVGCAPQLAQIDTYHKLTSLPQHISADGIVLIMQSYQQKEIYNIDPLLSTNIPIAFLGGHTLQNKQYSFSVLPDDRAAAYQLTSELAERGCRRIIYVGDTICKSNNRYQGYLQFILEHRLDQLLPVQLNLDNPPDSNQIEAIKNSDGVFLSSNRLLKNFQTLGNLAFDKNSPPKTATINDDSQLSTDSCVAVANHSIEKSCQLAIHTLLNNITLEKPAKSFVPMQYQF
jgi:DNA-binding LacI/PurR family transcriptional regulator